MTAGTTITIVLPVDEAPPREQPLARGVAASPGARIGVIDNRLWRSMPIAVAALASRFAASGMVVGESIDFDHLAPDFLEQQAALEPFAGSVDAAIAGLGN